MRDLRPVLSISGRLLLVLGLSMLLPLALDASDGRGNWQGMALAAFLTLSAGAAFTLVTQRSDALGLSRRQAFLLTTLVWVILPAFGALPFVYGAPGVSYTDAYFEAMSGFTTTGSTVFSGLDTAPRGMLLWRALLQWYGGVGIVVFAIVFLPALKVGGMQFFRAENFDVQSDIVPRAVEIAGSLFWLYIGLTALCMLAYSAAGMSPFDALCHAMTTISTGGLANYDASFGAFSPAAHYVGVLFMWLAALPFIRFIELSRGNPRPLLRDSQVRAFLGIVICASLIVGIWIILVNGRDTEEGLRVAFFNVTSVMTGTGYGTEDFSAWGGFPVTIFFAVALIGGCSGSTSCAAKVFRFQILFTALAQQVRYIYAPSGVFPIRYQGRPVEPEIVSSIMAFFFIYVASLSILAIMLSVLGLSTITAISGSVAVLANIGPGLGPEIGPAGNFAGLPDAAKWLLSAGMLLGRLEFLSVLVLFLPSFWLR